MCQSILPIRPTDRINSIAFTEAFRQMKMASQSDIRGESGIALWCAFHHGSILSRSYGDMGYVDYYRLPLNIWYYYRETRTGVEPEFSQNGTASKLQLSASSTTIKNDGTSDTYIIVTVTDDEGSWLDIAEIELNVMTRQCLSRRIENIANLREELAAWEVKRNTVAAKVNWRFRTADARVKLSSLYPKFTTASE